MRFHWLAVTSALFLSACGGSGQPSSWPTELLTPPPPTVQTVTCIPPPEGVQPKMDPSVMGGTIPGRRDPSFILVTFEDYRLLFYGPDLPATPRLTGFIGAGNPGGWCDSNDTRTYNGTERDFVANTEGTRLYLHAIATQAPPSVTGTLRFPSSTYPLSGGPIPGTTYTQAGPPSLAGAVGSWTMTDFTGTASTIAIDASGSLTGTVRGCPLVGAVTAPAQASLNLLQVRLDVPVTCPQFGLNHSLTGAYTGFAIVMPMNGGGNRLLVWVETDNGFDWDYVGMIGAR